MCTGGGEEIFLVSENPFSFRRRSETGCCRSSFPPAAGCMKRAPSSSSLLPPVVGLVHWHSSVAPPCRETEEEGSGRC